MSDSAYEAKSETLEDIKRSKKKKEEQFDDQLETLIEEVKEDNEISKDQLKMIHGHRLKNLAQEIQEMEELESELRFTTLARRDDDE